MVGLFFIWAGKWFFPGVDLQWIDSVSAIGVALLIVKAAYELTLQSAKDLVDVRLPENEEKWIYEYIMKYKSNARGFHRLRTRKSGGNRFIEFHLIFKADCSVGLSHSISDKITAAIKNHFPSSKVIIHIEPCDWTCKPHCIIGCFLTEEERRTLISTEKLEAAAFNVNGNN